jgi:hypothetical protein
MALAVALFALVIVGALVAGALFTGTQEHRIGESVRRLEQSFGVAELGVHDVISKWNTASYSMRGLYPTDSVAVSGTSPKHSGSYAGHVYRLNAQTYFIDITGHDTVSGRATFGGSRAQQRIGVLARLVPLKIDMQAALTVGGPVVFGGGNVYVKGQDTPPAGWGVCGAAAPGIAGVRAKNAGDVVNSQGQVTGTPNVLITPSMDSTTFTQFGSSSYAQLAARANVTLGAGSYGPAPVVAAGVCNIAVSTNWGDGSNPAAPCGTYFPIIHLTGNVTLTSGEGQGILLADGNVTLSGSFIFYGLVITKGSFTTVAGASSKIYGGVMAQSINLATTAMNGDVVINYSNCALQQAVQQTGLPALSRSRSWTQLF